ncbi:hypothetical protein JAAARDRAFT_465353 [Jaapia argillacea MUCL 33604]|uniref:HTH CENPB-type domain-containing protein n=1 Tax=Jaapia argillacea MUCL 33604 TaxID=933084 RepID=A0A067Q8T6_9AGAM|nr:hypothetical protein JAAARDRAFT_465353 [Jaapia argillacea MUCL 33604]
MDLSNAEQCLVYPSPPHPQQIDASIPGPCWQMNHHSPPVSSSSSATPSQMYPVPNRTTGQLAYPQQSTSSAYHQPQPVPQYIGQQQSLAGGHVQGSNVIALGSPQINGSIGPSRVLTRRQARAAQMTTLQRPSRRDDTSLQPGLADDSNAVNDRHHQAVYFMHPMSRPHTPNNLVHPSHYQRPPDHTVMTLGNSPLTMSSHSASPTYPSTPLATPFSPYLPYHVHSRSDSTSTSNPRSASPALSVASALTSISSASGPNTHTFSTFPPNGANMSPVIQRQKHRKHRLFNVDRKEICIYHKENPTARQEDIAAKYGVERSTISKILKNKAKWLNVPDHEDMLVAKHRPSKFPEIEEELRKWLVEAKENNTLLTDSTIRTKAKEVARFLQIPEDKFKLPGLLVLDGCPRILTSSTKGSCST